MSPRSRVLLDCRMASWTGVGRYTVGLAKALTTLDELELVLVVAAGEEPPVTGECVSHVVSLTHPFVPAGMLEMSRIVAAEKPDLVHALHFPVPFPAPHPMIVTMHDLSPLVVEGLMPSAAKRAVYRSLTARAVKVADRVVCDSTRTRLDVEAVFPAARGKSRVVLLAADDFSAGPVPALAGELSRIAKPPYVLSMGSTRRHKDLPTLLAAFATVAAARADLRLVLVGARDDEYLTRHVTDESVRARVHFTGRVSDDELRALYAAADVFAFPSLYEGFGLPPLEAMALGTPTVVADSASLPEVVGDGAMKVSAGDAVAFANAILGLFGDEERRSRLAVAGRMRAAELTWAQTASETLEVYREVMR